MQLDWAQKLKPLIIGVFMNTSNFTKKLLSAVVLAAIPFVACAHSNAVEQKKAVVERTTSASSADLNLRQTERTIQGGMSSGGGHKVASGELFDKIGRAHV